MSVHEIPRRTHGEEKLAILETVHERGNVRLSTLRETLALEEGSATDTLLELREADLVSTCPVRGERDSVVASLPRLRESEATKLYGLVYN